MLANGLDTPWEHTHTYIQHIDILYSHILTRTMHTHTRTHARTHAHTLDMAFKEPVKL